MENIWCREFQIGKSHFDTIYENKVRLLFDKSVSEFSYKLLHNMLTTTISVSKWDKNNSGNCDFCDTQENIKHLIFECDLIKPIWSKISQLIKIDIKWKMIVIGFIIFNNKYTFILDNTLSFLACKIYKYKMKCRIVKDQVTYEGVCRF